MLSKKKRSKPFAKNSVDVRPRALSLIGLAEAGVAIALSTLILISHRPGHWNIPVVENGYDNRHLENDETFYQYSTSLFFV